MEDGVSEGGEWEKRLLWKIKKARSYRHKFKKKKN
jgi:hypothetical protein